MVRNWKPARLYDHMECGGAVYVVIEPHLYAPSPPSSGSYDPVLVDVLLQVFVYHASSLCSGCIVLLVCALGVPCSLSMLWVYRASCLCLGVLCFLSMLWVYRASCLCSGCTILLVYVLGVPCFLSMLWVFYCRSVCYALWVAPRVSIIFCWC